MSLALEATYALLRFRGRSTETAETALASAASRVPAPVPPSLQGIASIDGSVVTLTPPDPTGTHLVYTHGGCYLYPVTDRHWTLVESLIMQSGATVSMVQYPLAPGHGMDEAYALLEGVYLRARAGSDRVLLGGDSAGGGLALGQALRYRDLGIQAPEGVILFSPWVDVTMSNPAIPALVTADRMLGRDGLVAAGEWWAGPDRVRDPLASPLYGDLAGLPPVHIFQGGRDLLAPDAVLLAERIRAAGGTAELEFLARAFHVYVAAPWLPEARRSLAAAARLLRA